MAKRKLNLRSGNSIESDSNPVAVFLPVSEVFSDIKPDLATLKGLLSELSRTEVLIWCSLLNLVVSDPSFRDEKAKQQYCLSDFFTNEQIGRVNEFAAKVGGERARIFFRGQLLELIRWAVLFCEDQSNDGNTFTSLEVRQCFAKAALIASDFWSNRVYANRLSLEGGRDIAKRRALPSFRQAMAETWSGLDPLKALGRGRALFCNHLPKYYPELAEKFRSKTDIALDDYYTCLATFSSHILKQTTQDGTLDPARKPIFNVTTFTDSIPHMKEVFARYFALESQSPDDLRMTLWGSAPNPSENSPYDLNILRRKPILCVAGGRAIVMDPVFYAERASVGPLFMIVRDEPQKEGNKIFSAFGNAFEDYALGILRRMYPKPEPPLIDRLTCNCMCKNVQGNEVEFADASLVDAKELVLFEIKAIWLKETKNSQDADSYSDQLIQKYATPDMAAADLKGVSQLANTITKLASGEWVVENLNADIIQKIYPILLVHDTLLNSHVHTEFLAQQFAKALSPDDNRADACKRKGRFWVAPLIVLSIDDLESLETSVREFSLCKLFGEYSAQCPDRCVSLYNFIRTSHFKDKINYSETLTMNAEKVMNEAIQKLFPQRGQEI